MGDGETTTESSDLPDYRLPLDPLPVIAGSCVHRFPELLGQRSHLDYLRSRHLELTRRFLGSDEGRLFLPDFFMVGIMQRSYGLVEGLIDAVDSYNLAVAAPLVRLQIDTLIRTSYVSRASASDEIVREIMRGTEFRKMKDPENQKLTDARLMELATPYHQWAAEVYSRTSGWVHLSPDHLRAAWQVQEGDNDTVTLSSGFPTRRDIVPARLWAELLGAMIQATQEIFGYVELWEARKGLPPDEMRAIPTRSNPASC